MYLAGEEKHSRTRGVENNQREDAGHQPHINSKQLPMGQTRANQTREGCMDDPRGWAKHRQVPAYSLVAAVTGAERPPPLVDSNRCAKQKPLVTMRGHATGHQQDPF
jgi:hypothetical protein